MVEVFSVLKEEHYTFLPPAARYRKHAVRSGDMYW